MCDHQGLQFFPRKAHAQICMAFSMVAYDSIHSLKTACLAVYVILSNKGQVHVKGFCLKVDGERDSQLFIAPEY